MCAVVILASYGRCSFRRVTSAAAAGIRGRGAGWRGDRNRGRERVRKEQPAAAGRRVGKARRRAGGAFRRGAGCWGRPMRSICWRPVRRWRALDRSHVRRPRPAGARARRDRRSTVSAAAACSTLLVSHEEDLLRRLADEIWWLHEGRLAGRGDPEEMLRAYRKDIAARVRAWGETLEHAHQPARAPRRRPRRSGAHRDRWREMAGRRWSGAAANWRW